MTAAAIAMQGSSVDAYHAQGHHVRMTQAEQVLDVMRAAYRSEGIANMTCSEITERLQRAYPHVNWHQGKASARINQLKAEGGPLVQCETERQCSVTGRKVHPLMLRPVQERLVA